jgi:hypothetical protein
MLRAHPRGSLWPELVEGPSTGSGRIRAGVCGLSSSKALRQAQGASVRESATGGLLTGEVEKRQYRRAGRGSSRSQAPKISLATVTADIARGQPA